MRFQPIRRWDREAALLAWLATCISILSFLVYLRRGEILLYGDAVAHINIARRVFDSRTPGLLQLGTVWLPLPHLLMLPFLFSDWMWKTGVGGSIPSMAAYVFGTLGVFRLIRGVLCPSFPIDGRASMAAWGAAIIYAANPNLIYLQATAMTEPLYLALFIWALVYFNEFLQAYDKPTDAHPALAFSPLVKSGICLFAACLTRYDGWLFSAMMCAAGLIVVFKAKYPSAILRRDLEKFVLLAAAAPVFWLAYNTIVYRNPLEFATGPYSAKAIEQRTPGASHPGSHNLHVALSYFLKSAELNLAAGYWQKFWVLLALAGVLIGLGAKRVRENRSGMNDGTVHRLWPLLLLLVPLVFYPGSIAYGGVPVFVPVWWPFSYYNVRYGLQLLPAFAVFVTIAAYLIVGLASRRAVRLTIVLAVLIVVIGSYISIWRDPVCLTEAWINSRTRVALEREVAEYL